MLPSDDAYDSDEPPSLVDPNVNYDNYALEEVERSPLIIDELQHVSIIVRPRSEDSSTWSWERRNIAGEYGDDFNFITYDYIVSLVRSLIPECLETRSLSPHQSLWVSRCLFSCRELRLSRSVIVEFMFADEVIGDTPYWIRVRNYFEGPQLPGHTHEGIIRIPLLPIGYLMYCIREFYTGNDIDDVHHRVICNWIMQHDSNWTIRNYTDRFPRNVIIQVDSVGESFPQSQSPYSEDNERPQVDSVGESFPQSQSPYCEDDIEHVRPDFLTTINRYRIFGPSNRAQQAPRVRATHSAPNLENILERLFVQGSGSSRENGNYIIDPVALRNLEEILCFSSDQDIANFIHEIWLERFQSVPNSGFCSQ